jgi:hypothetical protein
MNSHQRRIRRRKDRRDHPVLVYTSHATTVTLPDWPADEIAELVRQWRGMFPALEEWR